MSLRDSIKQIIKAVKPGCYFDSHFVIDQLLKLHSDQYINHVSQFAGNSEPTKTAHAGIGQEIDGCIDGLGERVKGPDGKGVSSWSITIRGTGGRCALWRRN